MNSPPRPARPPRSPIIALVSACIACSTPLPGTTARSDTGAADLDTKSARYNSDADSLSAPDLLGSSFDVPGADASSGDSGITTDTTAPNDSSNADAGIADANTTSGDADITNIADSPDLSDTSDADLPDVADTATHLTSVANLS